jgi:trigger factor
MIPAMRERSRPEAIERIKRSLALQEVAKRESIQVEPATIEARVKELMTQYSGKDIDQDRLREVVEEELLTEKIMDWLEEHSTIELVPEGSLKAAEEDKQEEILNSGEEDAAAADQVANPSSQTDTELSQAETE